MPMANEWFGCIEAGGTKFMCAIGNMNRELVVTERIPTTTPEETMAKVKLFFDRQIQTYPLKSFGICSFGPLDLRKNSPTYRQIVNTPKPGWSGANIAQYLEDNYRLPAIIDTDVNGAVLSEYLWGAGQGLDSLIYLTIGTGIGGGAIVEHNLLHGFMHPEMGHILIPHDREIDPYTGHCPYHHDCFEGLANGPALQERWGKPAYDLPADHPAWKLEARYISEALVAFTYILSPQRIILSGGVMQNHDLYSLIRDETNSLLAGYLTPQGKAGFPEEYIVRPGLEQDSGLLGAIALAITRE